MSAGATPGIPRGSLLALFVLCSAVFLWTAPGRIQFPDDEIVFQTTESLWERGTLAIDGIPKRTGEPRDRPDGTFGWAPGPDGRRYGFFGHGLSIVALPAYGLADATRSIVPHTWPHAVRSDHYVFHKRSPVADWTRLVVSLTNAFVTAATACVLVAWLVALGFAIGPAFWTGGLFAFGTLAWPYTRTFLSEPLSALCLVAVAAMITRFHNLRELAPRQAARWLWTGGLLAGASLHVHILNVVALPCFLGFALAPLLRDGTVGQHRRAWLGAVIAGLVPVAALLVSHFVRFGDPLETGRFGHYSHFEWPWVAMVAQVVAPGRSFFLYSPVVLVGLLAFGRVRRRIPDALWFTVAVVAVRWVFVSSRSDWYGGWAIGPRYLVPVIAFATLPLAQLLSDLRARRWGFRIAVVAALALAVALCGHLARYSIFEWMWRISIDPASGNAFMEISHWRPEASPIVGFLSLKPDMLSSGAARLAEFGHPGLRAVFRGIAATGALASLVLVWLVWRRRA